MTKKTPLGVFFFMRLFIGLWLCHGQMIKFNWCKSFLFGGCTPEPPLCGKRISPIAMGESGRRPNNPPPFEKGGRKLSNNIS